MHRRVIEPEDLAGIDCSVGEEGWTLVFVRILAHPSAAVWTLLTDPARLRLWAPCTPDRSLDRCGPVALTISGSRGTDAVPATVVRSEPGAVLEFTLPDDRLRWDLEAVPAGTWVRLRHTFAAWEWAAELAAGWHLSFDVAQRLLDRDVGGPAGGSGGSPSEGGRPHSWNDLFDAYAQMLIHAGWHDVDPCRRRSTRGVRPI